MKTINFKGIDYPHFQSEGFAAQFAFPFAQKVCAGNGVDVGCMKKEWAYPGAIPIDISFPGGFHALNLPFNPDGFDYIFSSHCLEHLDNWVETLQYWHSRLKLGGVIFLYLPNMDEQNYWRPWHNKKHLHYLTPDILKKYVSDLPEMWSFGSVSHTDLNSSFYVILEK